MSDIKHDPEFPYVVFNESSEVPVAKFISDVLAADFALNNQYRRVIDTTPKPKIPEDAEFIFVEDNDQSIFAHRIVAPDGGEGWMLAGNGFVSREELLEYIGDEPVTVMIEKEEA